MSMWFTGRNSRPTRPVVIENWLNTELYKATDRWFGNVRLVSYATPRQALPLEPGRCPLWAGNPADREWE
jgi:hypothetical protein